MQNPVSCEICLVADVLSEACVLQACCLHGLGCPPSVSLSYPSTI